MHVLMWIVSGFLSGWLARIATKQAAHGLAPDLALGLLGAVFAGTVFRLLGIAPPDQIFAHVLIGAAGAVSCLGAARALAGAVERSGLATARPDLRHAVQDIEAQLRKLPEVERRVLAKIVHRERAARDTSAAFDEQLTFGDRVADRMAAFGGSWTFIWLFVAGMAAWISYNAESPRPLDPYPFILLNLVLSCVAAMQAPVIMMSQNRQATKDRMQANNDYEVNLKAEMEIASLHGKFDELREQHWSALLQLQERQLALLERIDQRLGS